MSSIASTDEAERGDAVELMLAVMDSVSQAIVISTLDGLVQYANAPARELLCELGPQPIQLNLLNAFDEASRTLVSRALSQQSNTVQSQQLDVHVLRSGAGPYAVRLGLVAARTSTESPRLVWSFQEGPSVKEPELARARKEASRARAERDDFLHTISHDLQAPVRAVVGFGELLESRYGTSLDDTGKLFLTHMVEGGRRLQRMLEQLLGFARLNTQPRRRAPVSMTDVVRDVLGFDLTSAVQQAGAEVEIGVLPTVFGDAQQLHRLMHALLENALRFRSERPLRVAVEARRVGSEWIVGVRDNGIGIAAQQQARLFRLFQRLHAEGRFPGDGTGLAVAKRIVEGHGGRIWVDSELDQGACFWFALPAEPSDEAPSRP